MISPITRRLLRDWKRLWHQGSDRYHVRPQDSNLRLWNFVLNFEAAELYGVLFCGGSDTEPVVVMRCFTPNGCFPANQNVSLTHLAPLLLNQGLTGFLEQLCRMAEHTANLGDPRFMRTWNRVMIKDFKVHFPQLYERFTPESHDLSSVQLWTESRTKREPVQQPTFRPRDLSPLSNTIACDNSSQGKDTKRRKTAAASTLPTHIESECDSDLDLHRKRRPQ
ncbi:LAME_0D09384g1_1 [Lachancea meyersii CBS 8951]|uniref:LAME_0D09384g1_1 n=1 Tax=Lachancea meyersii CBS 8951 TaxID=1266667 RepID=A0A1G4JB33_9SACH|nr:LAME_0D09384g1_1 [Lachancea meyersii CBS 8951]